MAQQNPKGSYSNHFAQQNLDTLKGARSERMRTHDGYN